MQDRLHFAAFDLLEGTTHVGSVLFDCPPGVRDRRDWCGKVLLSV